MDDQTLQKIEDAVQRAFSAGIQDKRYIDVSRIPLICQSITQIGVDISEIKATVKENTVTKTEFWPIKTLVYGIVALMLAGVVGALLMLILKQ